ncbi:MAG TPA: hypothetical protein VMU01_03815 [Rhizomicrobium sp.]|nr:hypothetical protein [Rhizomicrobium sp.]
MTSLVFAVPAKQRSLQGFVQNALCHHGIKVALGGVAAFWAAVSISAYFLI